MEGWLQTFCFAYYPYICISMLLAGLVFRHVYLPGTWNSQASVIMEKKWLRIGAPLFHTGVLLTLAGHIFGLLLPDTFWEKVLGSSALHDSIALFVGKFLVIFMLVGLTIVTVRRLIFARVRTTSKTVDYVVVALLFVNIFTGLNQVFFLQAPMFELLGPWLRGLIIFQPDPSFVGMAPLFMQIHILSAFTIFALIPFSRLVHLLSFPATYLIRPLIVFRRRYSGL